MFRHAIAPCQIIRVGLSLEKAFRWGLRKLLFVPASTYDGEARVQQHRSMTEAAELAGNWTCL